MSDREKFLQGRADFFAAVTALLLAEDDDAIRAADRKVAQAVHNVLPVMEKLAGELDITAFARVAAPIATAARKRRLARMRKPC